MIQFNLLPDVKLEYIRAKRLKRVVTLGSMLVAASTLAIFVLLFVVVNLLQKKHLSDLNRDITKISAQLQATPDLGKVLTVQNQLSSLTALHEQKPVTSRLFEYLKQVTPAQASIEKLDVDFEAATMDFSGAADSLGTVNKFVDTLKFTTFKVDEGDVSAFSEVVLSNFTRGEQGASYQITLKFDPAIFDSGSAVKLTVPKITTTRSETEKPEALFQQNTTNPTNP